MAEILEKEKMTQKEWLQRPTQEIELSGKSQSNEKIQRKRKWPEKSGGNFGEREDDPKVGQQKQKFQEFDSFFAARI